MKRKKRKLKKKRVFLLFFLLLTLGTLFYLFTLIPVRSIYVIGNKYYTDEEILDKIKVNQQTPFLFTNSVNANLKIRKDKVIKNITIKKNIFLEFNIIVKENRLIYVDNKDKKTVLENGEKIDDTVNDLPVLINEINDKKIYEKFISKFEKVSDDSLNIISEIKYDPNDIDKERFLLSMNDGNYVYITLSKFSKINDYSNISKTLVGKQGILYLDYGNYFLEK